MKTGMTISVIGHAVVLASGLVWFVAKPMHTTPPESLPVDIMSAKDFSQLTKGIRTAQQKPDPKPLVERVGEARPVENPTTKVVDKPEITPTADQVQPPPPEPVKVAEPKPKPPTPQPKPEPKQREAFAP